MPGQSERKKSVRRKLSPIELEFGGKNVLLVDDSIVRGTTSKQIVQMARESGANKVYLASAAPPVRYPNVYGIDMPAAKEFVAHGHTVEEIADYIGADWLLYQELDDLIECASGINDEIERFDTSIFDGNYISGNIDENYLSRVEGLRNDSAKAQNENEAEVIELHNQL